MTKKADNFSLYAVMILGIVLRLIHLDAPLASDELTNASIWGQMPFSRIISNYQAPNNHIFLSLVLAVILKVFGVDDVALRLPVLVCGILSIFIAYMTALRITRNPMVAMGTSFLLAISSQHVYYSTNARGYMFIMVFAQIVLYRVFAWSQAFGSSLGFAEKKPSVRDGVCLGILCFLGTWTVPTFALFEVSLGVFFFSLLLRDLRVRQTHSIRPYCQTLLILFVCLCGFYIQYFVFISRDMLKMGMSNSFSGGTLLELFPAILNEWSHPFEPLLPMLVALAFFGGGVLFRENRNAFHLLLCVVGTPLVIVAISFSAGILFAVPHARVFAYLQPLFFTTVAVGGYFVAEKAGALLTRNSYIVNSLFSFLCIPFLFFSIVELNGHLYRDRMDRESFPEVLRFVKKLGLRDLILASRKTYVGFYLYGASEMRKRVENIIDAQTLGDVYFLVYSRRNVSDMQIVSRSGIDYFKFLEYANLGSPENISGDLLIPAALFEPAIRLGDFEFYKVKPRYVQVGSKLKGVTDMENWLTTESSSFQLEPFKASVGMQAALRGSAFLLSRNPAGSEDDFFSMSINLASSTDDVLYLNGRLRDDHVVFNRSWAVNDWTLDHPYGSAIFNRVWRPAIYLSEARGSFEMIRQANQKKLLRGLQSYRLTMTRDDLKK